MYSYSTTITDSQWLVLSLLIDDGRKRKYSLRSVLDGIFYLTKTGCQWRMLPKEFPPYRTVYYYFRKWCDESLFLRINLTIVFLYRLKMAVSMFPSLGMMDAQSIKNSEWGVQGKGFDGNKKIKGRKRNLLLDSFGQVLGVHVHPANERDAKGAFFLLDKLNKTGCFCLKKILVDKGYRGPLIKWALRTFGIDIEVSNTEKSLPKVFEPIPMRWRAERSISWLMWDRRLSRDFEEKTASSEALVYIANMKRFSRKLAVEI